MKRIICILSCLLLILAATLTVTAMVTETFVQVVHIKSGSIEVQLTVAYQTLEQAIGNAESGDIIEIYGDVSVSSPISIPEGYELTIVSGTKREYSAIFGRSSFKNTDTDAAARTVKKNFDGTLFVLGENSKVAFDNIVLDGNGKSGTKGGLIYVSKGAELTLNGRVTAQNAKLGTNSYGGAIYVEKGGSAKIGSAVFRNNSASHENNVYAEDAKDVTTEEQNPPVTTTAAITTRKTPITTKPTTNKPTITTSSIITMVPLTMPEVVSTTDPITTTTSVITENPNISTAITTPTTPEQTTKPEVKKPSNPTEPKKTGLVFKIILFSVLLACAVTVIVVLFKKTH